MKSIMTMMNVYMRNKMLTLNCNCRSHTIEIEQDEHYSYISIYDLHSNDGKKYKKPKLSGDVVLTKEQINILQKYLTV